MENMKNEPLDTRTLKVNYTISDFVNTIRTLDLAYAMHKLPRQL
jgi:hypothetical protein